MIPLTRDQMKRTMILKYGNKSTFMNLEKCLTSDCLRFCAAEISDKQNVAGQ